MLRKKKITSSKRAGPKKKACLPDRQGQSTVEYIILVAVVIGALIAFSGTFNQAVQDTFKSGTGGMQNMANRLQSSRPLSP